MSNEIIAILRQIRTYLLPDSDDPIVKNCDVELARSEDALVVAEKILALCAFHKLEWEDRGMLDNNSSIIMAREGQVWDIVLTDGQSALPKDVEDEIIRALGGV